MKKIDLAYDTLMDNLYCCAGADTTVSVSRAEYRYLLMEYTRMGLALAEAKDGIKEYKQMLYEAMKGWTEYGYMDTKQRQMFDELKMEFETEGSLEE